MATVDSRRLAWLMMFVRLLVFAWLALTAVELLAPHRKRLCYDPAACKIGDSKTLAHQIANNSIRRDSIAGYYH